MPRLRSEIARSVFYLYAYGPDGKPRAEPEGTGSIISRQGPGKTMHYYAVSNWHLTNDPGTADEPGILATIIRLNTLDGSSRFLEYHPTDWQFVKNGHDVSVVDITDDLRKDDIYFAIPERLFISTDVQFNYQVGPGDDVLMIGMFANHFGVDHNIPVVRFGNISLDAMADNPIPQENGTEQPSHLADMRSRSGFSGSPVLVFRNHVMDLSLGFHWGRDLRSTANSPFSSVPNISQPMDTFIGFLGVHVGQFWDEVKFSKTPAGASRERLGDEIREGDDLWVQGGMTVIAPAWHVTETIDLEVLQKMREDREVKNGVKYYKLPQAESVKRAPKSDATESSAANPDHKEDFTSLLGAAARAKPSAG